MDLQLFDAEGLALVGTLLVKGWDGEIEPLVGGHIMDGLHQVIEAGLPL